MSVAATFHTHIIPHETMSGDEATRRHFIFRKKKIYTDTPNDKYLAQKYTQTYTTLSALLRHILIDVIHNGYHRLENLQLHINYYTNLIYDEQGYAKLLPPNHIDWSTYRTAVIGSEQALDLECVIFTDLCNKGFLEPGELCDSCPFKL